MKKRVASIVLVSALGVGGVSTVALTPALAAEAGSATSQRVTGIKNALKGLVSDGTITQAQADKVATTLDQKLPKGPKRKGHHLLEDAAKVLGMTAGQLRSEMGDSTSLAEVAAAKGVAKADLIDKLYATAEQRLAAAVKEGRLTQAQADEKKATIRERITQAVDREGLPMRPKHPRGGGQEGGRQQGPPPPGGAPSSAWGE